MRNVALAILPLLLENLKVHLAYSYLCLVMLLDTYLFHKIIRVYRVTQQVPYLGWDFDLDVPLILRCYSAHST